MAATSVPSSYLDALRAFAYEEIAVDGTVKTLMVPTGAQVALVRVDAQPIRYRMDGTTDVNGGDPSTTSGMLAKADEELVLVGREVMAQFKVTKQGVTNSLLTVTYFKGN